MKIVFQRLARFGSCFVPVSRNDLRKAEQRIVMKVSELSTALGNIATQLDKAQAEIVAEIAALKAALENVDLPADAQTALDNLSAKAQALDDLNPDAPTPPPA